MKLSRRKLLHLATGVAALPMLSRLAGAQSYPSRPVRIVAAFAAGGGVDITARLIAQWLSDRLGRSFVVENRPGAGGNIGTETVVNAPPDGQTLLLATLPNAVNATLYEKLNFNFIRDTAPVAGIIRVAMVILVHPSVPAKTVPELIAYAKANPGKINMASAGAGSAPHMAGELFNFMASVHMVHVPRPGTRAGRFARRAGAGLFRHHSRDERFCQNGQTTCACGDEPNAGRRFFRAAAGGRFCGGLRSEPVVRHRRSEEHAGRSHR